MGLSAIGAARARVMRLNLDVASWSPYKALRMVPSGAGNVAAWCSFRRRRESERLPGGLAEAINVVQAIAEGK